MDEKLNDLLVRSFDQDLTPDEQAELDNALQNSEELRLEKEQLLSLRSLISNTSISPGQNFSSEVMDRIAENNFSTGTISLFKKIAYAGAASIIILLGSHLLSGGSLSLESFLGIESVSADVLTFNVIGH
ncbi:MAG: hypothetical protein HYZ14_12820 [Bacteroidetes bacterium]|nr:hypothetical protein [Bacteroidota bacterium]